MDHPKGLYTMSDDGIQLNIESLAKLGIEVDPLRALEPIEDECRNPRLQKTGRHRCIQLSCQTGLHNLASSEGWQEYH